MSDFERSGPPPADRTSVFLQVGLGLLSTFLLHGLVGGALYVLAALTSVLMGRVPVDASPVWSVLSLVMSLPMFWMFTIGVSQVLYVGPAALVAFVVRRPIALGLVIGAALTFLLQSACYGLAAVFLVPLIGMH